MFCIQNAHPQKANCLFFFFFSEIASAGIAEVTWSRAPIHTKIGRLRCCSFYLRYCPGLQMEAAAKNKYSPLGCGMRASSRAGSQWAQRATASATQYTICIKASLIPPKQGPPGSCLPYQHHGGRAELSHAPHRPRFRAFCFSSPFYLKKKSEGQ